MASTRHTKDALDKKSLNELEILFFNLFHVKVYYPGRWDKQVLIQGILAKEAKIKVQDAKSMSTNHMTVGNTSHVLDDIKLDLTKLLIQCIQDKYNVDMQNKHAFILSKFAKPKAGLGDVCFPCFLFARDLKAPPHQIARDLGTAFEEYLDGNGKILQLDVAGGYLNFFISLPILAQVIPSINSGNFLSKRPSAGKTKVMIEYSQPNTHKVFHVGHMRNAALGDSLVRFYEQVGHHVVAVNYFGDEGAHVAKCLWGLRNYMKSKPDFKLDEVPVAERAEFLGQFYSKSVEELSMATYTSTPFPGVYAAKVISVADHPDSASPPNWHVVVVEMDQQYTVVCGGIGYKVGDMVAYIPCGQKVKGKLVEPKDMKGVLSHGIIVARKELGLPPLKSPEEKKKSGRR